MGTLSEDLKEQAVACGLCEKWTSEWRGDESQEELLDKFIKGINFCINKGYPTEEMAGRFDRELLHRKGIYTDGKTAIDGTLDAYVFMGDCDVEIVFGGYSVCTVYVRHKSRVTVRAGHVSRVVVMLYDDAMVDVVQSGAARVSVVRRGERCRVGTCDGDNIRVRYAETR